MTNYKLTKTKISGQKVGVYFGQFNVFHKGHLSVAQQALMENDSLVVVVSGSSRPTDRSMKVGLPLHKRVQFVNAVFNDEPDVKVQSLNEDDIPEYPGGWNAWTKRLIEVTEEGVIPQFDQEFVVYVGEPEYVTELEKRLPINWSVRLLDRSIIPVSSTKIINDLPKYWDYITEPYRPHFSKKVCLMGSASTGKSTLVKRLANIYGTVKTDEAARTHEIENFLRDENLEVDDYAVFLNKQFEDLVAALKDHKNKGIVFADTDALVTLVYMKMYMPEALPVLEPLAEYYIRKQDFDLIMVIPPVTSYVDDGFRAMEWEDSRYDFHNQLMEELEHFNLMDKVVLLDGTDEHGGYYTRYNQALEAIKDNLNLTV